MHMCIPSNYPAKCAIHMTFCYLPPGYPVTTESIRYGMRVGVLALPANPMLLTPEAMAVVGPQAFGFNVPYTPPRPLPKRSN